MQREQNNVLEKIVSLCKRRGFVFPGSEIYGGLAGTWSYGPLGLALKANIERLWWNQFVERRDDMYGIDSPIISPSAVGYAPPHFAFSPEPLFEVSRPPRRSRADHLLKDVGIDPSGMTLVQMGDALQKHAIVSPEGNPLTPPQQFNMMFKTSAGAVEGDRSAVYLRPENAQGMFLDFKNILDSYHPRLPFGIAQIGRAFRNEIAPRDFLFRVRELEIMEFEWFTREAHWQQWFEYWNAEMRAWFARLGFAPADVREVELPAGDRAHYSKRTVDFHFNFPIGFEEIGGLAYRTDFDLSNHYAMSGVDIRYTDPDTGEKLIPHVIEPTFGLGRHILAVLSKAYDEDDLGGERRIVLRFPPHIAPRTAAVFPLLKNKPELLAAARSLYVLLKKDFPQCVFDDNGNIGKRYRRQDEVGTPYCITVDFDTLADGSVTLRERDSGEQTRVATADLPALMMERISASRVL